MLVNDTALSFGKLFFDAHPRNHTSPSGET